MAVLNVSASGFVCPSHQSFHVRSFAESGRKQMDEVDCGISHNLHRGGVCDKSHAALSFPYIVYYFQQFLLYNACPSYLVYCVLYVRSRKEMGRQGCPDQIVRQKDGPGERS